MTGIAIVGQGYMGRTHAGAWTRLGHGGDIRYIQAPGARAWTDLAPAARFVADLDDVLGDPAVDVVSVCTPTPTHAGIAVRALAAGKHVLLEKPVALSLADAERIRQAAGRSGRVLMVAQVVRFFAGYQELRRIAESGELGQVTAVRAARTLATPTWADWWADESQSGGVPVDFSVHDYDQTNLFLGTPVAVTATRTAPDAPMETLVEYAGGGLGQVLSHAHLPAGSGFASSLELVGTRGLAAHRLVSAAPTDSPTAEEGISELVVSTPDGVRRHPVPDDDPYLAEVEYFARCVATGEQPTRSPIESAIAALRVSLAARESLRRRARVTL